MASSTTGIAEIVLIVKDVKRAANFYRYAVGLTAQGGEANDEWAWFWTGEPEQSPRIGLHKGELPYEQYSSRPAGERFGPAHFALNVPAEKLEEAVGRVRVQGVEVRGPQKLAEQKAMSYYFYDFDGNLVEYRSPQEA
jgi:catechol 2,3-dioxygenase-like lactoylglutathione lyase family enzyme